MNFESIAAPFRALHGMLTDWNSGLPAVFPPSRERGGKEAWRGEAQSSDEGVKISLRGVTRSYTREGAGKFEALQDIHLDVRAGEFLCIVGPSGCGKSTLLHLISGLDRQSKGEILLHGLPVNGPGPDRIMIFQDLGLFPWLTVRQNVEFGLRLKGLDAADIRLLSVYYLDLVHLSQFAESYIHQLSGGMRQRVALARSLAMQPEVLLMDEPFAALDAQTRDMLHDELERIWHETRQTIVFVTHNVREAARLGDRVVVMTFRPGRIKKEIQVDLPRPRNMEDPNVVRVAGEVMDQLRGEIRKSTQSEFQDAEST
jgi:NitT/TauT family transport system ATP-binding protein